MGFRGKSINQLIVDVYEFLNSLKINQIIIKNQINYGFVSQLSINTGQNFLHRNS